MQQNKSRAFRQPRSSKELVKQTQTGIELIQNTKNMALASMQKSNNNEKAEQARPSNVNSQSYTVKTYKINQIDGEAARRMIENIKGAEKRMTEMKKECRPHCQCKLCRDFGYTRKVCLENMHEVLWRGYLIINPNTEAYQMVSGVLNYRELCNIRLNEDLIKLKYFIDKDLYLPMVKFTHLNEEQAQFRILANRKEIIDLYVQTILAIMSVRYRFWMPFRENECVGGFVYKRYSINGNWEHKHLKIEKNIVIDANNETITIKSPCLWTSFQMIDWNDKPHLIIKLWEGLWKVEYGLPIDQLSDWLFTFLSFIEIG